MAENRKPPQNIEAEESVLGAMLIKKDAIIEAADGAWAGIEVKIGHNQAEKAAANLLRLSDKIRRAGGRPPAFLLVLEGLGDYAYRRTDGVYVAPIAVLAP